MRFELMLDNYLTSFDVISSLLYHIRIILIVVIVWFRIACDPSNPFLDSDLKACVSQPGCFFDHELSAYRQIVGQAILPHVPVCHLVIRNRSFQKRANEMLQLLV